MLMRVFYLSAAVIVGLLSAACPGRGSGLDPALERTVAIDSVSPRSGPLGSEVTIYGSGFMLEGNDIGFALEDDRNPGNSLVRYLNGIPSLDGTTLQFRLPDNEDVLLAACAFSQLGPNEECPSVGYLLPTGDTEILVANTAGTSETVPFTVVATASP